MAPPSSDTNPPDDTLPAQAIIGSAPAGSRANAGPDQGSQRPLRIASDGATTGPLPANDVPAARAPPDRVRRSLRGWSAATIQHPLDRDATGKLGSIPGMDLLARKIQEFGMARAQTVALLGSGLKVSERQLPTIDRTYRETAELLGIDAPPKLYIMPGGVNAYTFEAQEPFVVLQSGLLSCFNEEELIFALAHELGHVLYGHARYSLMARNVNAVLKVVGQATLGIGALVGKGVDLALLEWQRKAELSCDRVGVMALQDGGTSAITALMKLAGAPSELFRSLNVEAFLEQAREFEALGESAIGGMHKLLVSATQNHPWSVRRAAELMSWLKEKGPEKAWAPAAPEVATTQACGCGHALAKGNRFCPSCGAAVAITPCGHVTPANSAFCGTCGTRLASGWATAGQTGTSSQS